MAGMMEGVSLTFTSRVCVRECVNESTLKYRPDGAINLFRRMLLSSAMTYALIIVADLIYKTASSRTFAWGGVSTTEILDSVESLLCWRLLQGGVIVRYTPQ